MAGRLVKLGEFLGLRQPHVVGKPIPHSRRTASRAAIVDGNVLALPIVRRCMGEIANLVTACEPVVIDAKGREVARGWAQMPTWLRQPNPLFTGAEMLQQQVWSLYLQGELFVVWNVGPGGQPRDLWVPRAEDISTYWQYDSVVYTDWMSGEEKYADRLVHRRLLAAPEAMRGVGVAQTGRTLTGVGTDAADALSNHILRDAILGVVFTFTNKLNDGSRQRFLDMLAEHMAGPENAGSPLVMEGDGKVSRVAPSMQDEKLLELNRDLSARIASEVFFLNPRTFDLGSNETSLTYRNAANLRSDNFHSAAQWPAQQIGSAFSAMMPGTFKLDPVDNLRGPPEQRSALATRMAQVNKAMHSIGQPLPYSSQEIREVLGYSGPPPVMPAATSIPQLELEAGIE